MLAYGLPLLIPKLQAKAKVMGYDKRLKRLASNYDVDDLLGSIGLKRARTTGTDVAATVGLVLGGLALGAVLGLMFAPAKGEEFRRTIRQDGWPALKELGKGMTEKTGEVGSQPKTFA